MLFSAIPRKINSPSPPEPMSAQSVATPTLITVAVLMPAKITGTAKGSSTLNNTCRSDMPIPLAASQTAGSTSSIPVYVFLTIGRRA